MCMGCGKVRRRKVEISTAEAQLTTVGAEQLSGKFAGFSKVAPGSKPKPAPLEGCYKLSNGDEDLSDCRGCVNETMYECKEDRQTGVKTD